MIIPDIAKLAGVSVVTVSRALNNKGYVKEKTRQKIENLTQENGYRPNAVARSLTRSNASTTAVIMPNKLNPLFANIPDTIESWIEQQGYSTLFYNTPEDRDKEHKAITQAIEHRVMGILLLPALDPDEQTEELFAGVEGPGIPVVLTGRDLHDSDLDTVLIDNKKVVYEGVKLLVKPGYRKIGTATCPEVVKKGKTRLDGYVRCLKDYGMEMEDERIYPGDFDEKGGHQACENLLGFPDPPTVVLVTRSSTTLGCIRYLNEHSLQIGRDIGLAGFDDIFLLGIPGYEITVMDRPMKEMGEIVYDLFTERMASPDTRRCRREILLQTRLITCGSEKLQDVQVVSQEEYL